MELLSLSIPVAMYIKLIGVKVVCVIEAAYSCMEFNPTNLEF